MKTKKIISVSTIFLLAGLMTFLACKKDDDSGNPDCNSYISASATGFVTQDFCFSKLAGYNYQDGHSVAITANQEGDVVYSCMVEIGTDASPFTGPGTYQCGGDKAGYVELIIHGKTENEFYKPTSGTITVTEAANNSFKATFNVTLVGYYNQQTVTLSGTVKY